MLEIKINNFDDPKGQTMFLRLCNTIEENLTRDKKVHMVDIAQLVEQ